MEQKINRTLLAIYLATMLGTFALVLLVLRAILKPSFTEEVFVGGLTIIFAYIAVANAVLRLHGKRSRKRKTFQWIMGFVIGPAGLGVSVLIGSVSHHTVAGMILGGITFLGATLYCFIGPRPKPGE